MTYFPDGETRIPNQVQVPGSQPPEPPQDPLRHRMRAILRTAVINGALLVAAILLAYIFPVSDDPNVSLTIMLVAAIICGLHMAAVLWSEQRYAQRARLDEARSSTYGTSAEPTRPSTQPYGAAAPAGAFSLAVEDVFTITGRGAVVTGRVASGSLHAGSAVRVVRAGQVVAETQVTAIEMFRKKSDVATAGENVGLLLDGVARADLARGDQIVG